MNKVVLVLLVAIVCILMGGTIYIGKLERRLQALEENSHSVIATDMAQANIAPNQTKQNKANAQPDRLPTASAQFETMLSEQTEQLAAVQFALDDVKKPKSCNWVPITNQSRSHSGATKGKEWVGECPAGYYAKGFKLSTWGEKATYHHAVQCCAL